MKNIKNKDKELLKFGPVIKVIYGLCETEELESIFDKDCLVFRVVSAATNISVNTLMEYMADGYSHDNPNGWIALEMLRRADDFIDITGFRDYDY